MTPTVVTHKGFLEWLRDCEGRAWSPVYTEAVLKHITRVEQTSIALGRLHTAERIAAVAREIGSER